MDYVAVKWNLFTADCCPKEEADYLLTVDDGAGVAVFKVVHWYRQGTKVKCELKNEFKKNLDGASIEDKLIEVLWGNGIYREITIPEDGFYMITGDYLDCYENGEYQEFRRIPEPIATLSNWGLKAYWAMLPGAPAELTHPYEEE